MPAWDPKQYTKFERERTQPARDLLARVDVATPARVADLGCGPGNSTALLFARWPAAQVDGVDNDDAMLAEARKRAPDRSWRVGDAATWAPGEAYDVVFSNAALHWVPDHARLMPRLLAFVRPGGALAVQMPRNFGEPSHTAIAEVAADGPWAARLRASGVHAVAGVHEPAFYYDALVAQASSVELWETQYVHVFDDAAAVVEWVKGSALRPTLDALAPEDRAPFVERYRSAMARHYPARSNGKVLFPFRRLFFVATR
jgi:trans-aconitate 2-methyltransferase